MAVTENLQKEDEPQRPPRERAKLSDAIRWFSQDCYLDRLTRTAELGATEIGQAPAAH